jgi:PIN domain nuclease of toxin-antitoxin system
VKLLLDTHIWLWSLTDPDRISSRVRKQLSSSTNELWLSPISVWEILLLVAKRRIDLSASAEEWFAHIMSVAPTREAPLTHDVAMETRRVSLPHRDPADRFLVATANVFGLTLVTADAALIEAKACPILASR